MLRLPMRSGETRTLLGSFDPIVKRSEGRRSAAGPIPCAPAPRPRHQRQLWGYEPHAPDPGQRAQPDRQHVRRRPSHVHGVFAYVPALLAFLIFPASQRFHLERQRISPASVATCRAAIQLPPTVISTRRLATPGSPPVWPRPARANRLAVTPFATSASATACARC